jgi:hypothetical protein
MKITKKIPRSGRKLVSVGKILFFLKATSNPSIEEDNLRYFSRQLVEGSEPWDKMRIVVDDYCGGRQFMIQDAYAIYNEPLIGAFITQR